MRLDQYIVQEHNISRALAQKLIKKQLVTVNGEQVSPHYGVRDTDVVEVKIPEPERYEVIAEDIPLKVVYEDSEILALDKAAGMVVHPACGHSSGTLVHAIMSHCQDLSGIGGVERPGIVHRLDKDTSGLILIAKNDLAHSGLAKQFQNRTINKKYRALVCGNVINDNGTINQPLGRNPQNRKKIIVTHDPNYKSRHAITHYQVTKRFGSTTLLDVSLETGRTHQIRVHLAFIGYPILGDPIYGKVSTGGLRLQAYMLEFKHPRTNELMHLEIAPLEWGL